VPRWFHVDAFFEYAPVETLQDGDATNIEGFERLREVDQEMLVEGLKDALAMDAGADAR
jgi:hypothetical protein